MLSFRTELIPTLHRTRSVFSLESRLWIVPQFSQSVTRQTSIVPHSTHAASLGTSDTVRIVCSAVVAPLGASSKSRESASVYLVSIQSIQIAFYCKTWTIPFARTLPHLANKSSQFS